MIKKNNHPAALVMTLLLVSVLGITVTVPLKASTVVMDDIV